MIKTMRLLLIYPDINTNQFPHFQHGLAWISAVAKQGGHQVELLYLDREWADEELIAEVKRRSPDLVAFSSTTQQWLYAKRYARALKQTLAPFLVIGGIHATISPQEVMGEDLFNVLVRGEGEYPLLELMDALAQGRDYTGIPNLWSRLADGSVKENPVRPPVDLAQLPWPDRELFDNEAVMRHNDRQVAVMASRGCPFRCTYCCNTALADLVGGNVKWARQRPLPDLLAEIEDLHRRFPDLKSLIFMDEIFTLKKTWVRDFCAEYKKRFRTPFQIFIRVEIVDQEMMQLMAEAGLYAIIVGVESGNERIRREVLNRKMTNEQIIRVFKWADELGLETWSLNMIGVPGDSEATIRETIELVRRLKPHHSQTSIFYPFPGTPLYERCVREGYTKVDDNTSFFFSRPVLDLPDLPREKALALHLEFMAVGHQLEAQKSARGDADLAALYSEAAVFPGGEGYMGLWRVRVQGEERISILMHPSSRAVYALTVKPRSVLRFGMAFSHDVWDKPGAGATFEVRIKTRLRGERVVFSEYIDPKHQPEHRRWLDREVDLARFGGKTVELTLATSTPPDQNQFCAAFWSRPFLEESRE